MRPTARSDDSFVGVDMKKVGRLGSHLSAAILAVTLSVPVAVGAIALVSTPAFAQTALTGVQISAIQTSLTAALQAAHGDRVAIEAAISQAVQNAIALYGTDATAAITSAIMSMAEQAGVSQDAIGAGLAQAAAAESATNVAAATAIARTVANEGKSGEILAFQARATSLGYANLASIAGSGATPTGETGSGGGGGLAGGSFGGGAGGGGGGCLNPSCTAL